MKIIFFTMSIALVSVAQTVTDLPQQGVRLYAGNHPKLAAAIAHRVNQAPFTVLVSNESPQDIVALSFTWSADRSLGAPPIKYTRTITTFGGAGKPIAARSSYLASRMQWLEYGSEPGAAERDEMNGLVHDYGRLSNHRISLDAVAFGDGSFYGPDPNHMIRAWGTEVESRRQVYALVAAGDKAALAEIVAAGHKRMVAKTNSLGPESSGGSMTDSMNMAWRLGLQATDGAEGIALCKAALAYAYGLLDPGRFASASAGLKRAPKLPSIQRIANK